MTVFENSFTKHTTAFGATFYVENFDINNLEDPERIQVLDSRGHYIDYIPVITITEEAEIAHTTSKEAYEANVKLLEAAPAPQRFMELIAPGTPVVFFKNKDDAYKYVIENCNVDEDYTIEDDPDANILGDYIVLGIW